MQEQIPEHVPPHLVRDFDMYRLPGLESGQSADIHALWKAVQDESPPVFWTPHHGGHWVVHRHGDMQQVLADHATFSNAEPFIPKGVIPFQTPVQLDPPDHTAFRKLLMPAFSPAALARATQAARQAAVEIIEEIRPRGGCEFVADFAGVMPIIAFLNLIDLPAEDSSYLRAVAMVMSNPANPGAPAAWAEMSDYVRRQIDLRRAAPRDDLISSFLRARVLGRALTEEEVFSMTLLVVGGGLDTVASMTGLLAAHLAQHPELQRQLADNPALLDNAPEEVARRFGTSNLARLTRRDAEISGVKIRAGDIVLGLFPLAGLDERVNPEPLKLDFTRQRPLHFAFGTGPHTCIGNRLAKREIRIFLEEWLGRIPEFRLKPGTLPHVHTGIVNSVTRLELVW